MFTSDQVNTLLQDYKDQNEWQRHNENQRAQLTNMLLLISAALIAFLAQRGPTIDDWPMALFLILAGGFGILSVEKYWERFQYHLTRESALRQQIDLSFDQSILSNPMPCRKLRELEGREVSDPITDDAELRGLSEIKALALMRHSENWSKGSRAWLRDERLMQHRLWEGIFVAIAFLGVVFMVRIVL
jgi:hypothetical protein